MARESDQWQQREQALGRVLHFLSCQNSHFELSCRRTVYRRKINLALWRGNAALAWYTLRLIVDFGAVRHFKNSTDVRIGASL
jgi:hypothetical protein